MAFPTVVGSALQLSGIKLTKSPRYGGGDGPLYSTVNERLTRVARGDLAVIRELDQLRRTDADKVQWQLLWDTHVPLQPLTDAQRALIIQLDPSKAGVLPPARYGPPVLADPNTAPPDPLSLALQPVQDALDTGAAALREGAAQTIERVAVGAGAAGAREARGEAGPLDKVIAFAQDPTGAVVLGIAALVILVGGVFLIARVVR